MIIDINQDNENNKTPNKNNEIDIDSIKNMPIIEFATNIPAAIMKGMCDTDTTPNKILKNLNTKEHTHTLFRDNVIEQLMTVLIGESHPNALLVGPAGTGKTKIVEELAYRIENNDNSVPDLLKGFTIYSLQISDIVAGSNVVGALEEKCNELIAFLSEEENKAILFLDEFHMLFNSDLYEKIAQILKPALSRSSIKVIGATTTQEVKSIETDPAFKRRFTKVIVDELSKEQTIEIVNSYITKLNEHYKMPILFEKELIADSVNIADEYFSQSHRPDNAVTLIDRTVASAVISKYKLLNNSDPNIQNMGKAIKGVNISKKSVIKTALKMATGHNEPRDFVADELRNELKYIKGQDSVINEIVNAINLRNMHIRPNKKPLTFLFIGSSGVGKTEISKIIAKYCTNEKPIMLNMTEFFSAPSINRIIGAPAGYVGYDSNCEMPFDILDTNPYQVIILDEFDKAHKSVQNLFMNAFEEGYIKNSNGKIIDFSKSIIIATTNAGYINISNPIGLCQKQHKQISIEELSNYFDIALINRFNHKITFNDITHEIFENIMCETYETEVKRIKLSNPKIPLDDKLTTEKVKELCNNNYNICLGARPIKTVIENYIDQLILEHIEK